MDDAAALGGIGRINFPPNIFLIIGRFNISCVFISPRYVEFAIVPSVLFIEYKATDAIEGGPTVLFSTETTYIFPSYKTGAALPTAPIISFSHIALPVSSSIANRLLPFSLAQPTNKTPLSMAGGA